MKESGDQQRYNGGGWVLDGPGKQWPWESSKEADFPVGLPKPDSYYGKITRSNIALGKWHKKIKNVF